jgi:peptidoglycan/xylan/chitin deacetylase (PgdA/CDA1 family)
MSKRRLLATTLQKLGILRVLELYKSKPCLLIISHHRIGKASHTLFDREVFSATEDEFDLQLKYFKKYSHILSGVELEDLVFRKTPLKRMYVAITFDDGYLDNYTTAFDILRANDCTAAFFLISQYVGTSYIPWWDEIAYLVRNTKKQKITLQNPVPLTVTLDPGREAAIHTVLSHYKRPDNHKSNDLLAELREQADCALPQPERRFLSWAEARQMKEAGMDIGSHTCSHPILRQVSPERQLWEMEQSKKDIEENLGGKVTTLAYPVGTLSSFDGSTEQLASSLGYTMCFSFYGGINTPKSMNPTNLLRSCANPEPVLFRTETILHAKLGKLPY